MNRKIIGFAIGALITISPALAFADDASSTPDTVAPVIVAPLNQTFEVTNFPATPALTLATATDDTDPNPNVAYAPTSFNPGTTTVVWTAKDASNNAASTTSNVGVFLSVATSVDVPASCTATDSDGVAHTYEATATSSYLAVCAFEAAVQNGAVASSVFSNAFPSIGLFVTSINGVAADPNSQFWALFQNGAFASLGLTQLQVAAGDMILLQLQDFNGNSLGHELAITISSLIATSTSPSTPPSGGGGGGGGSSIHQSFNLINALSFLSSKQNSNGSFDAGSETDISDWVAIAFAAHDPGDAKNKLRSYMQTARPSLSGTIGYERHAMGLEALGIDPYSGAGVDYITPIVSSFNGSQFGDTGSFRDDIFAFFALEHAGYAPSDAMFQKSAAFIISKQGQDGGWEDADTTASAIQALGTLFGPTGFDQAQLGASLGKAIGYLASQQQNDGGWQNADSTSWVQTMINSVQEGDPAQAARVVTALTKPNGAIPMDYLVHAEQSDGSVMWAPSDTSNHVWSTAYAVTAASSKSWLSILHTFSKPAAVIGGGSSAATSTGLVLGASTSTLATSTIETATSSPTATSTPVQSATSSPFTTEEPTLITIATSTGTVITVVPAKLKAAPKHTVVKKPAPKPKPQTISTIIESPTPIVELKPIASSTSGGPLKHFWSSIVSFFVHLL